ncbi:MAG: mechanosensitive ion channel [Leptospira sp.]|nr:mechanosensitive ion channel [Leptospira sp.]
MRFVFIFLLAFPIYSQNILNQVKTGTPRQTIQTFLSAMNDYREGVIENDKDKMKRIDDAIRTLNLEDTPIILRKEKGRETSILLKEVIDRLFKIDYSKIPDEEDLIANPIKKYYLNNSEIALYRVDGGERDGAFLFSKETIHLTPEFYEKVSHLPYLNPKTGGAHYQQPWMENYISPWMKKYIIGIMIWQWIGLTTAILLGLTLRVIAKFLLNKLFLMMKNHKTIWDYQIIENIKSPVALLLATALWYLSLKILRFHGDVLGFFHTLLKITLSIGLVWSLYGLMEVLSTYLRSIAAKTESSLDDQLVPLLSKTLKIVVVIFGVLVAVQNIGINVMGVLAGLGLGGLAFALAAKDGIANFFGSLMILLDKPF